MKKKAIFLDRDGTINIEKDYLYKIEDFQFEEGTLEALKLLKEMGYLLIIVTNQAGIGRGYYTEEDLSILHKYLIKETEKADGKIDKIYYCPHHPTKGIGKYKKVCDCRKPGNGMIERGIKEFDIDREHSFMIGDKISDIEAGLKSGIKTVLVRTGYGDKSEIELTSLKNHKSVLVCDSLFEFALKLKNKNI